MIHLMKIIVLISACSPLILSSAQGLPKSGSVPIRDLLVLANSTAELPCDTTPVDRNDEVILVLWFRENMGTPIFSADARIVPLSQAGVWFDDDVLRKRGTFRGRINDASILAISDIGLEDQAVYRCRVDFREAKSRNARVNLTVIEPPRSLKVVTEFGQRISSTAGLFRIGDRPVFSCLVEGGIPRPRVEWRRNGVLINSEVDIIDETIVTDAGKNGASVGSIKSNLILASLKRSDWPLSLTCSASNSNLSRPLENTFDVDMELPPVSVAILVGDRNPTAGRPHALPCYVAGSRPVPKITWWRSDQLLDPATHNQSLLIETNVTISVLNITLDKLDLGTNLTCRAINPYIDSAQMEHTWTVDLGYPPNVSLAMGRSLKAEGIKAGDDVYFDCHIDARPPSARIEWRRNGIKLTHNATANIIITNQSLVLQNVGRSVAGNISCVAFNLEGQTESQPIYLDIKYPPVCKPGLTRYFGVSRSENVEITCQVEANPSSDLTYKWFFNNSAETIEVPRNRYTTSGPQSLLTYRPMASLDYGTLLCFATNSAGSQNEPCVFHILTAGPPEPVFNCTVSNHSNEAVLITCQAGFHGGLPQNFSLYFYDESSSRLVLQKTLNEPVFLLSGLKSNTRYKASISSTNAKGKSEEVLLEISTHKEPERQLEVKPEPRPSNSFLTPTLGILSGVVVVVCMGGVIVALFLRRHCTRRRHDGSAAATGDASANNSATNASSGLTRSSIVAIDPRSQSLKPLIDNVECDLGAQLCAARMQNEHWKSHMTTGHSASSYRLHPHLSTALQPSWPVGEPPPAPLPPVMTLETSLIAPPYLTDSTMDLRSPDIIPPPSIGSCDFGPATLPRSYKGFNLATDTSSPAESHYSAVAATTSSWTTNSESLPAAMTAVRFQPHEFLLSGESSNGVPVKRESVV